ncbi:MAG TPA: hypothetical protein DHU59_09455 [Clostridiales bacterium]|nr:hypothetical protein [Clostridiales bacterium]
MWSWIMKRKRRNKGGTRFYMMMSIICLTVLFIGYSYVYNLSEKRKSGQDITTISILYNEGSDESKTSAIDKIMSYFNIFLEKTFKEKESSNKLIESVDKSNTEVFKKIESNETEEKDLEIYNEREEKKPITNTPLFISSNRHENFFKIIESSPASRSSAPRNIINDAASVNEKLNVVIFHTHATEAYFPHVEGNYRSHDETYNVMGVGNKITSNLKSLGIDVNHLKDYNDYPDYNSSYANSSYAVSQVLSNSKKNVLIDIHRDGAEENSSYEQFLSRVKTTIINDKTAATCTLVVGDKNGNSEELKKNAQLLFNISEQMYPGLFRDVIVRPGAYFNQYYSDYALLLEVGSTLNHIDEVNYTIELLTDIMVEYIDEIANTN